MYAPNIKTAKTIKRYKAEGYSAAFVGDIKSEQGIQYEFIIVVFEGESPDPFLFVTSERNDPEASRKLLAEIGLESLDDPDPVQQGGSHFLCVFDERGHSNLGDSNDWGNAGKFEQAALEYLQKKLGVAFEVSC